MFVWQLHSGVYSEADQSLALSPEGSGFKRKLSKREKKEKKKLEKEAKLRGKENETPKAKNGVAQKLYNELPETSFTRSISNPEAVMKRRRQMKLEKKLQQFKSRDGGPDTGRQCSYRRQSLIQVDSALTGGDP